MATGTTAPEKGQRGHRALSAHGDGSAGLGGHSSEDIVHGAPESSSQPQGHCAPSSQRKTPSSQSIPPEVRDVSPSQQCLKVLLRCTDPFVLLSLLTLSSLSSLLIHFPFPFLIPRSPLLGSLAAGSAGWGEGGGKGVAPPLWTNSEFI